MNSTIENIKKPIAILDANAFISMTSLYQIGTKARIVTTPDVLEQLRDAKTKQFIQKFPFTIETIDPDQHHLAFIKQFAKKTGDIASLSLVDMQLLAVAYGLYKKEGLNSNLRKQPPPIFQKTDLQQVAGQQQLSSDEQEQIVEQTQIQQGQNNKIDQKQQNQQEQGWIVVNKKPTRKVSSSSSQSDDEQGWITSKNYETKMAQVSSALQQLPDQQEWQTFSISIISSDFAVQNVAVQIGMKLISLDGRKIKSIRRFIYQCYLCWNKYRISDQKIKLCSNCGYNSLSKIAYTIDQEGKMILHRKKGWKPNKKITQIKQKKYEEQQRNKKHQHARRKKKPSIFQ